MAISVTEGVIATVEHRDPTNIGDLEMDRPTAWQNNESTEGLVTALSYRRRQSFYKNVLPAPKMTKIRPLEETVRVSLNR
ncbi:uncharacterized protein N0V89_009831 [Didymosphaeria variabile]|uniref:Uncharacterized protein n=1 Tax=Didymosphaeria variabile TaxID=1932322 RepID=A0A9W8XE87_9PLEO|nr:uncharacterized protein N0V89_009831 [Didymosphaeria variabile]KAJ4348457.1 hypothetical protein N0V89_009831 [Didymosphaeria variabile]